MAATLDWIRLSLVPGLGLSSYWRLIDYFKTPTAVLRASKKELLQVRGIREQQIAGLFTPDPGAVDGRHELDRLMAMGGFALSFEDPWYPPLLRQLSDPPPVLYALGRKELLTRPAIAIVGSRAATSYGRNIAFNLARNLSSSLLTVVSGLALGIDAESHTGALTSEGGTIAVLGCGLDVVYPPKNLELFRKIRTQGAVLSEYPLGTRPDGFRFPARNRIIAGLSKGVVVVEAAKRSGSLITAQIALDCGREVFAVPGHIDSCKSEGTHWLLKQGAKLVQSAADITEELSAPFPLQFSQEAELQQKNNCRLEPDAITLLNCLDAYPQMREELLVKTGFTPARVSQLLLLLELDGWIEMLPGDKMRKIIPIT